MREVCGDQRSKEEKKRLSLALDRGLLRPAVSLFLSVLFLVMVLSLSLGSLSLPLYTHWARQKQVTQFIQSVSQKQAPGGWGGGGGGGHLSVSFLSFALNNRRLLSLSVFLSPLRPLLAPASSSHPLSQTEFLFFARALAGDARRGAEGGNEKSTAATPAVAAASAATSTPPLPAAVDAAAFAAASASASCAAWAAAAAILRLARDRASSAAAVVAAVVFCPSVFPVGRFLTFFWPRRLLVPKEATARVSRPLVDGEQNTGLQQRSQQFSSSSSSAGGCCGAGGGGSGSCGGGAADDDDVNADNAAAAAAAAWPCLFGPPLAGLRPPLFLFSYFISLLVVVWWRVERGVFILVCFCFPYF